MPAWSGFHQLSSTSTEVITTTGYMPLINAPAHEFDTLWEVIRRCKQVSKVLDQQFTVITFDEALYCKAMQLLWLKHEETKDVVLRLGSFHLVLNYMRAIGQYLEASGIKEIWEESGVYSETTADNILRGKNYNRCFRAHRVTLEAVWRLVWPQFEEWCKRNGHGLDPIRRTASLLADMCRYGSCTETENALGAAADETANILPLLT
ncbi:MAG: hypothetical protein ABW185_26895, partial [Sedimenticola sp.]